jgi:hypothetical protein
MPSAEEADRVRQLRTLAEQLAGSETPVVQNVGLQVLGLAKLLVTEVIPEEFEHLRPADPGTANARERR